MLNIKAVRCRAIYIAWLLLFAGLIPAKSQNFFFDNYGIKQGLSEQKVYTLLQDSKDNIWLGTANGLSRFDGKNFRNFTTRDSLAPGGVRCITEDSDGNIWLGHLNGGVSRFNGSIFERAAFDSLTLTGDVNSIAQVGNSLWLTTYNNGAIMIPLPLKDIRKIKARQFTGKDGLSDLLTGSEVVGDSSFICIANEGFLRRYSNSDKKFENYRLPHYTTYFSTMCMLDDSKGNIWFGTYNGGIYKYNMPSSHMYIIDLIRAGMSSNAVTCMTEDRKGRIWIGTWGGGIAVIEDTVPQIYDQKTGLAASRIYDIIEDVEGNILIADQNNGLTIFKGDAFTTFSSGEILPNPIVNAVYKDHSGSVWFGTAAGISRYKPGEGNKPVIYNEKVNAIPDDIRFFKADNDGNLWIGTNGGGVLMFNMKTNRFEAQPEINSRMPNFLQVTAFEIDKRNNLWIGTSDGVMAGTIGQDNFVRRIVLDSLTVTGITALYNDPSGIMWIGIEPSGSKPTLFKYEPAKDRFSRIKSFTGLKPISMTYGNGILWVGTNEGIRGLRNDSIVSILTQSEGLLSDVINTLVTSEDGSIFIGTNSGLNRYFPESGRIFSYTERNGFTGIESRPNAFFKSPDGDYWFGTSNGATRLIPGKASAEELEPLTHIIGMRVNYETRQMIQGMKLNYGERTILFDYYSICVTNPDVVKYKVMLEGADADWQPVTEQTRVTYPALAAGKYRFMVKALNSQGVWNKEPVTFSFIIKPPFYRTWWFMITAAVLILVGIIAYIKIREKNLVREKQVLEEKVKERTAEVVQKSMEIEEKNRDITASIRYAERIQRAMLPRDDMFKETFVLFMPKDIVSGDFYWMHDDGDHQYIAVCDCTGHGVPGAFMSIIGHNSLNKVVREYGITRPSAILDQLNTEVLKALMQRNEEIINDGMDMALVAFNRKDFTLEFAGAYNPLYVVRNGEVFMYKGDRFPIGMTAISDKKSFSNQKVDIQPGDMLYMCSDGYADQFGTEEVKKYKSGNVKKLLSEIWAMPVEEQRKKLLDETIAWRGNLPQVDDILFIGTKIPQN
ncbi:MAG TPA: two-component regulator propeller domain-containing protein [Bacteroidales bacterium]|nr:two-component regulator propeller domain-containing protein [Bacteroidales bacterium]